MASLKITLEQLEELAARSVQLEATQNDERASAATTPAATTALGGQGSKKEQEPEWESTLEPWADRCQVESLKRSLAAGLVNTSLTTPLPHAEAADPVALANSSQVNSSEAC